MSSARRHGGRLSLLAFALLIAALSPLAPRARAARKPLLVVVGANCARRDISTALLRRTFQGYPTDFEGGKRFVPLNQAPGSVARVQFDRAVLGLSPDQVGAFWIDRRIRDEGLPPRVLPSPELALRVVASLPGAITYGVFAAVPSNVKALTIDGKTAGQASYLLN